MSRVSSPLIASLTALALACAHAPAPPPAEEPSNAARPAPAPPAREPATAPPPPRPEKPAAPAPRDRQSIAKVTPPGPKPAAPPRPAAPSGPRPDALGVADYFPLAVGNEWLYVDQSPALSSKSRGTVRPVRIVERTADGFYRDNAKGYLRVDGTCVRDRDRRLLCEPFTVGAGWSSVVSATVIERYEIAAVDETIETPAGKFEHCIRVRSHHRVKASIDQVLEIAYAPRVGVVLVETYVVVDGKVTPQVKGLLKSYKVSGP